MKKLLVLALLFLPSLVFAQATTSQFQRNDNCAFTLQATNGGYSKACVDSKGRVAVTLQSGAAIIGSVAIDQTTPGTTNGVQINAAIPAGTNLIGKFGIDQTTPGTTNKVSIGTDGTVALGTGTNSIGRVNIAASVGNGYSKYTFGALVDTVQTVKGTVVQLGGYDIYNPAAAICYVQFFDVANATTVTLGTTVPDYVVPVGSSVTGQSARLVMPPSGVNFTNGMKIAATTTYSGAVACGTGLITNILYK